MLTLHRADGTTRHVRRGLFRRLRLRRGDGLVYLDRWGIGHDRIGRVFIHRMKAPDPGIDLHDYPWWFASLVLWGGYTETRADTREAPAAARPTEFDLGGGVTVAYPTVGHAGEHKTICRRPGTLKTLRLDECHTITSLRRRTCWTLVIGGPRRREWGFYLPTGFVDEHSYDRTVRAGRRDLWSDQNIEARPW